MGFGWYLMLKRFLLSLFFIELLLNENTLSQSDSKSPQETQTIFKNCSNDTSLMDKLLNGTGYNKHKVPGGQGVRVTVEFWVQEITSISEITNDFEMDIYINEMWLDPALRFDHFNPCKQNLSLNHQVLDRLWTPNSCFINSKIASIHESPFKNIFLMIYPNGTVWVNYRVKVKGPCVMDLSSFPMDSQTCLLTYESFNYNNAEVQMRWSDIEKPVYPLKDIRLPSFDLVGINTVRVAQVYPAGMWDELTVTLEFKRRYVWYFLQAYIPTYLTIFISWVSFTLGPKAIPARTMLGVNALLAMIFQFGNIMRNLPRVSYVKAIDVWMLVCMTFIFCSLVELAIIGYMVKDPPVGAIEKRRKTARASHNQTQNIEVNAASGSYVKCPKHYPAGFSSPTNLRNREREGSHVSQSDSKYMVDLERYSRKERRAAGCCRTCYNLSCPVWTPDNIDRASCVIFPTLFSVFNIVYWSYYTTLKKIL